MTGTKQNLIDIFSDEPAGGVHLTNGRVQHLTTTLATALVLSQSRTRNKFISTSSDFTIIKGFHCAMKNFRNSQYYQTSNISGHKR